MAGPDLTVGAFEISRSISVITQLDWVIHFF